MSGTGVHQTPAGSLRAVLSGGVSRVRPGRWWLRVGLLDVALALLVGVLVVVEAALPSDLHHGHPARNLALQLLAVVPVAFRHHRPVLALGVTSALIGLPTLLVVHDLSFWGTLLPLGLIHYVITRNRCWRTTLLALLLPLIGLGCYWWLTPSMRRDPGLAIFCVIIFGSSILAGRLVRRDADRRRQLQVALDRLTESEDDRHRLAVLDARTILARDLHDVVAQALSVMNVSAATARAALPGNLAGAEAAVRVLEAAGRDATADLRRMLGLLRATQEPDPTAPAPGVAQLPALVERLRTAGLVITVDGDLPSSGSLPAGFELAVLRIVQEALTNVLRHAGPTTVTLRIIATSGDLGRDPTGVSPSTLIIEVVDAGPRRDVRPGPGSAEPAASGATRHGLVGMAERVALYGGTLHAGPEGAGFAVRAVLPLPTGVPVPV